MFSHRNEDNLISVLEKMECDYQYFNHIPFVGEIVFEDSFKNNLDEKFFIFGSVNSCRIFESKYTKFLNPGTFFNENFDFRVYKHIWKERLLNYDSRIESFSSAKVESFPVFIRPCEDSKLLNGQVFHSKEDWTELHQRILKNSPKKISEQIQISTPKNIYYEVRCFVINRKVLTSSFYRRNNQSFLQECFETELLEFAQECVDIWSPIDNFVIDIALTSEGFKIIEIGCINCAGFYDIDLEKLINKIIEL